MDVYTQTSAGKRQKNRHGVTTKIFSQYFPPQRLNNLVNSTCAQLLAGRVETTRHASSHANACATDEVTQIVTHHRMYVSLSHRQRQAMKRHGANVVWGLMRSTAQRASEWFHQTARQYRKGRAGVTGQGHSGALDYRSEWGKVHPCQ